MSDDVQRVIRPTVRFNWTGSWFAPSGAILASDRFCFRLCGRDPRLIHETDRNRAGPIATVADE